MATSGATFPGASGDYIWAPDSAGLSVTGDIDIRACIAADDWTPAVLQTVVAKMVQSGNQISFMFYINTNGRLHLLWSSTGTAAAILDLFSTVAPSVVDGDPLWVRVTLDVDNGASGKTATFYTSTDPIDTAPGSVSWTQLGTAVTAAGTTSIFDSTARVELGSRDNGTQRLFIGTYYQAEIRNGINGTVVADPNILTDPTDPTVTTFSDGTNTWTVAGNVELFLFNEAEPAPIALTIALPAPAVQVHKTVTPDAIALSVVLPAVSAGENATVTPDAIPLSVVLPSLSGSASVGASTIALAFVLPAPSATGDTPDATVSPSTIALAFGLPAASATGVVNLAGQKLMLHDGSILGIGVHLSEARTAGTAVFEATIDGTPTGFTATIDGTDTSEATATATAEDHPFLEGQLLGMVVTTSGFTPTTAVPVVFIEVTEDTAS